MDKLVQATEQLARESQEIAELVRKLEKGNTYAFLLVPKHEKLIQAESAVEDEMTMFYGAHKEDESTVDALRGKGSDVPPAELEEAFRAVLNDKNIALLYGMEIHTEPGQETPQVVEMQETMEIFHARLKELYAMNPKSAEFTEAHETFKKTICEDVVLQFMKCVASPDLKATIYFPPSKIWANAGSKRMRVADTISDAEPTQPAIV